MKRSVETRQLPDWFNAYVLELMWQEQSAESDMDVQGHLTNLVSLLFLPMLLIQADVFSHSLVKQPSLIYIHSGMTRQT